MRLFRNLMTALLLTVTVLFAYVFFENNFISDKTYPTITFDEDVIKVGVNVTDEELLSGVTAYDTKDGDISDRVIVESVSDFTEKGVCSVTYSVYDNDCHVTSAVRKIKYANYVSPRFYLTRSLCYALGERVSVKDILGAYDVIDGDISKNIIVTSDSFESGTEGTFCINVEVTNSKGDTAALALPLTVAQSSASALSINLGTYLLYAEKGKSIDFAQYVDSVTDAYGKSVDSHIEIQTDFDKDKSGVYTVHYYADCGGKQGHNILSVIVETGYGE